MQLAICYYKRGEQVLAKVAIKQAFVETDLHSAHWKEVFDEDFYQFLQQTSVNIGNELYENDEVPNVVRCRLYATAKDWMLENRVKNADFLAQSLAVCLRVDEAIECYTIALTNCKEKDKAKNTFALIDLYKKKNDTQSVIRIAEEYFKNHPKEAGERGDPNEQLISNYLAKAKECQEQGKDFSKAAFLVPVSHIY